MKKKKLRLLALPLALALSSAGGIVAGTFAYFTSMDKATVSIEAGQVKMSLSVKDLVIKSLGVTMTTHGMEDLDNDGVPETDVVYFENGGYAYLDGAKLVLKKITPGDEVAFTVDVKNESNVKIKYAINIDYYNERTGLQNGYQPTAADVEANPNAGKGLLSEGLDVTGGPTAGYVSLDIGEQASDIPVTLKFDKSKGNEYQGATSDIIVSLGAIQWNAPYYIDEANKILDIFTVDGWNYFANRVDGGDAMTGWKVGLRNSLDFDTLDFIDVGDKDHKFSGTFNGYNNTISNVDKIYTGVEYGGLFAYLDEATIKDLAINNVKFSSAYSLGAAAAKAHKSVFQHVSVDGLTGTGSTTSGGLVGDADYVTVFNSSVKNINIEIAANVEANTVSLGDSVGGLIGKLSDTASKVYDNSIEKIDIKGYKYIGGVVGYLHAIYDSTSTGYYTNNTIVTSIKTGFNRTVSVNDDIFMIDKGIYAKPVYPVNNGEFYVVRLNYCHSIISSGTTTVRVASITGIGYYDGQETIITTYPGLSGYGLPHENFVKIVQSNKVDIAELPGKYEVAESIYHPETAEEFKSAIASHTKSDAVIVLEDDIEVNGYLSSISGKNVDLDLNGHDITRSSSSNTTGFTVANTGTLHITNSSSEQAVIDLSDPKVVKAFSGSGNKAEITISGNIKILAGDNVKSLFAMDYQDGEPGTLTNRKLTLDGVTIDWNNPNADYGIYVSGGIDVEIKDTIYNSPTCFMVAFGEQLESNPVNCTISGNTVINSSEETTMYLANFGTFTMNGGTISNTGGQTAVEIRNGNFVMNGGNITTNATTFDYHGNGSGTTSTGAALAAMKHVATNDKELNVTINGGTLTGGAGLLVANPMPYTGSKAATVNIKGGNFVGNGATGKGLVLDNNTSLFDITLSGGTFTKFDSMSYTYQNYAEADVNVTINYSTYATYLASGYVLQDVPDTNNVTVVQA